MVDPYHPILDDFQFDDFEKVAIATALTKEKPWDWAPGGAEGELIKSIKTKIRALHMQRHGSRCCYCRKNLAGGGHFVVDREHVLPKSVAHYHTLAFEVWNLGVACKRCNMQYKKERVDFLVHPTDMTALRDGANYLLIHPNFDRYKDHISISMLQDDNITLVSYTKVDGSDKAAFTYEFFNLKELEVSSHDEAQGRVHQDELGEFALEAQAFADAHGQ